MFLTLYIRIKKEITMFTIEDNNKPNLFLTNCTGCILEPKKHDQVIIITASGDRMPVGIQLPHPLSILLYKKIIQASKIGGAVEIPDMSEMDDDEIREMLDQLPVKELNH